MTGSSLVKKRMQAYAGNSPGPQPLRQNTEITVHHCAGIMSIDDLGRLWQRWGARAAAITV